MERSKMKFRLFAVLVLLLSCCFFGFESHAQAYKYMDEAGNINFVDRLSDVPLRYRNQIPGAVPTPVVLSKKEHAKAIKEKAKLEKKQAKEQEKARKKAQKEWEKQQKLQQQQAKKEGKKPLKPQQPISSEVVIHEENGQKEIASPPEITGGNPLDDSRSPEAETAN